MFKKGLLFSGILLQSTLGFASNCETKREIFIENKLTKVWETVICPNQRLPFHSHQFARVLIPKNNGQMEVIYQSGKRKVMLLKKDQPIFLSIEQGKALHQDVNIGKKPIKVMMIEIRQ